MKPWLKKQWSIAPRTNAEFVLKMEDVLAVYTQPSDPRYPLICMDETSKQVLRDVHSPLPAKPGRVHREDYTYERKGVLNLFLFCDPLRGWRSVTVTERRTKVDWAYQIKALVDVHYPEAERIRLVMDKLNTHTLAALYEVFAPAEARRIVGKLELHDTPKHGSWLNMAEIELSVLSRQCLNRRFPDEETLEAEVAAWEADRNAVGGRVDWRFTTADARIKLKHLYPTVQE